MNQHMETALHIFGNFQQSDWSDLLPLVQYQLNSHISSTTKQVPYETWMGFVPMAYQPQCDSTVLAVENCKQYLQDAWAKAVDAITQAQVLWKKTSKFCLYQKGDQVWLKGTNLCMSHPSHKLRLKIFGPFEIMEALSSVTYHLNLPQSWKLHNAFHASLLSPYYKTSEYGIGYLTPTPSLIEGEPEWEVDTILAA